MAFTPGQNQADPYDLILRVGGEGGNLSLMATRQAVPLYAAFLDDQTLTYIDEGPSLHKRSPWGKWADALKLLGRYPWPKLLPRFVDPGHAARIWALLEEDWPEIPPANREDWAQLCGQDATDPVFDTSPLRPGERVVHPDAMGWGIGAVLDESDGEKARAFFELVGERAVLLKHAKLRRVTGSNASSLMLDNLRMDRGKPSVNYKSVPASIAYFLREFPNGFQGERYDFHEGKHKREIHALAAEQLGESALRDLLDAGRYEEVCKRAFRLTGASQNAMIFSQEKITLGAALKAEANQEPFARALFDVLHGPAPMAERFATWAACLEEIGAAKWTIATYFLFFVHPSTQMFVKPTITQYAADVCAFDINYRPEVNARTYMKVLEFSKYLETAIAELQPDDMIDVQSFMWCIAPGTYAGEA